MPETDERPQSDVLQSAVRGAVAAMAMTGMRRVTVALGLVDETPPRAILRKQTRGLIGLVPRKKRSAATELMHWGYGTTAGAVYGALPDEWRRRPWLAPAYGIALWLGFELVQAPLMGLEKAKKPRPVERAALAADHVLYGLVLRG